MKIGDKVIIKESLAGVGFGYSEGEVVETTLANIEHIEGLMRGGSAYAENFRQVPETSKGANENTGILSDNSVGIERESIEDDIETSEGGISRSDLDAGQPAPVRKRRSNAKHPDQL